MTATTHPAGLAEARRLADILGTHVEFGGDLEEVAQVAANDPQYVAA